MVEKRFEKLGMSDIERFENYLPTAFNSELTLLQKVNKIIFDLIETNKLTNETVDYLNKFIEKFDEKLYKTIEDVLQVWLEDGRLADVVRVAISEEVIQVRTDYLGNTYLNLKERLDHEREDYEFLNNSYLNTLNGAKNMIQSQFFIQTVNGENQEPRNLQGGTIINNSLIYFLIDDSNKAHLIERDVKTGVILRERLFEDLGHLNDITNDGVFIYTTSDTNIIYKINYETLSLTSIVPEISVNSVIQGIEYYNDYFYLKLSDTFELKLLNKSFSFVKNIVLDTPDYISPYNQGIHIHNDIIIDVRGMPAQIYTYNLQGEFMGASNFKTISNFIPIAELQFIASNNQFLILGATGTSVNKTTNLNTFAKFNLSKPIPINNPYDSYNLTGVNSVYVDSVIGSDTGDGSINKPFRHILQAIPLLNTNNIGRLRIINGNFSDIQIQNKKISIYGNGNQINGLTLNQSEVELSNVVLGEGQSDYNLDVNQSTVWLGGGSRIEGKKPINLNSSTLLVSNAVIQTTEELNYNVYANRSTTNYLKKVNAINQSNLIGSNIFVSKDFYIDKTCSFVGGQQLVITPFFEGVKNYTPLLMGYNYFHFRVEIYNKTYTSVVRLSDNITQSRKFTIPINQFILGDYYVGNLSININSITHEITIEENNLYKLSDGTTYSLTNKPNDFTLPQITQVNVFI